MVDMLGSCWNNNKLSLTSKFTIPAAGIHESGANHKVLLNYLSVNKDRNFTI